MFHVSKEFAPPLGLIVPFFISGVFFYVLSCIALLFYTPHFSHLELSVAGWVHLFMVGYVMMIIFGAMAQLVPVVLETGHFSVDWYYIIFPVLLIGVIGLIAGFWLDPILLSFGGLLVLVAMVIFAVDVFLTIAKTQLATPTVKAIKLSNIFLLLGILSGFAMALALSGFWSVDIEDFVHAHVWAVVGGYVLMSVYGITLVLLPMFGLAHGFSEAPIRRAIPTLAAAVSLVYVGALFGWRFVEGLGIFAGFVSVAFYAQQISLIYKTRVRKELDIWYRSMLFGYASFAVAVAVGALGVLFGAQQVIYAAIWALFMFFAFLINGHLYKIIPFLVWFHRFSDLVGKQRVPMLHEMYPKKQALYQFWMSAVGAALVFLGLLFHSDALFKAGGSFMLVGAIFLATSVMWMIRYR